MWIAPERTIHHLPPRAGPQTTTEPVVDPPEPAGPVFGNLDPSLEHAWHPVALATELRDGGWLAVRLLGRTWTLERTDGVLCVSPPAWGLRERFGVVWLAPEEPGGADLAVDEAGDPGFRGFWLPPTRTRAAAGPVADAFLDVTHEPFVHTASAAGRATEPPEYTAHSRDGGFDGSTHDPTAPFPASYEVRAPFQLLCRQEVSDTRPARTVLVLLQPEDADSTGVYTCVFLPAGAAGRVPRSVVTAEVAAQQHALDADLALQERAGIGGLPLSMRAELHVPADRLGVALRRSLADFAVAARDADAVQDRGTDGAASAA